MRSPLRHDHGLCDPETCVWCALEREDADDNDENGADQ